jgi:hypothetical protein
MPPNAGIAEPRGVEFASAFGILPSRPAAGQNLQGSGGSAQAGPAARPAEPLSAAIAGRMNRNLRIGTFHLQQSARAYYRR